MSYTDLRRALLKKLGVTPQALHDRVKRKQRDIPMSTQDATCVIAHEQGIQVNKYLAQDDMARLRSLVGTRSNQEAPKTFRSSGRKASGERVVEVRFPSDFRLKSLVLSDAKLQEALEMARIYPLLYVLENSMREVIRRVMTAKHGPGWWDEKLDSGKAKNVRDTANGRLQTEKRNSWHQRRGSHPIDYVDLGDLKVIIQAKQTDFVPSVINDLEWFNQFMRELEPSRNVVCHMNPLDTLNSKDVRQKLERWNRMVSNNRANIP